MEEVTIHDCLIYYHASEYEGDDGIKAALRYFERHLNHDEIATYFHAARERGSAEFETNHGKRFKMVYQDGGYMLIK